MSKKAWIIFTVVVVGLLVSLVLWSKNQSTQTDTTNIIASDIQGPSSSNGNIGDHTFGKADSTIVIIEYGDFQCPPCANAEPTVKSLLEKYSDRILFVFRNYPIMSSHPNAKAAAAAAEAAGLQGKYWEMHDRLYANQSEWSAASSNERNTIFKRYASDLGLDMSKFDTNMASPEVSKKISTDFSIGKDDGVKATPTFKLNGENLAVNKLEEAIKAKLAN